MAKTTDVIQAMGRFGWSMSVFGATQAGHLLKSVDRTGAGAEMASALDAVADAVERRLGSDTRELYRTGDQLQEGGLDAVFALGEPMAELAKGLASAVFLRGGLGLAELACRTADPALAGTTRRRNRELRDRLRVFELFQFAHPILRLDPAGDGEPMAERTAAARRRDLFDALWLLEGLGYAHGEAAWDGEVLREADLLLDPGLPAADVLPLHTGMGLSLARRHLPLLRTADGDEAAEALAGLAELCRRVAAPDHGLATFEAVGLVVRQLAPDRLDALDAAFEHASEDDDSSLGVEHRAAFWHGVGRSLLFLPSQLPPVSLGRALDKAVDEADWELGRRNAVSGLAWAVALVHPRHPEILDAFLEHHVAGLDDDLRRAAADGVAGALALWAHHVVARHPDPVASEPVLRDLVGHRPDGPFAAARWPEWIGAAARRGAERATAGRVVWDDVFRYLPQEDR